MNDNRVAEDLEDIGAAIREGREIRAARAYRIAVGNGNLNFQPVTITDPVPLGRQILAAAGLEPVEEFSLFAILRDGDFEDLRLDEPFDLRAKGVEKFVAFRTDRAFKLTVRGDQVTWGKPAITGRALYKLAKAGPDEALFLDVPGGTDRLIEPDHLIDLTEPGIERFITAPRTYEIIVNSRPRVVTGSRVTFEQIVELAFPGPHEPNVIFSVTYRKAASTPHAGELGPGGVVKVKNGTIFNVTRTVQS
ncbi:MAG: multiubiquitin domain-containing protein [Planctomycetes bacterium]|nr:multiubiquitin domain-containing protein [Planctomycetota bacterium]